jgi:hypothetical protein
MTTQHAEHNETRQALYVHERRPRWGYAVLAYDHLDKRGFQFEDGKLRVFKRGYYQLLREVDPPIDKRLPVLEHLNRALGRREASRAAGNPKELLIPFTEQIAHFQEQHPEGFCGKAWRSKMRGVGAKRPLKRHRDHVVRLAREQLSDEALTRLIEAGQHHTVLEALIAVLEQTSLVTAAKLKPLKEAALYRRPEIAAALRELLYGEGPLESRFKRFATSMDGSWELATAPLALVHPEQYVCVRPSVFKQQAIWMAPQLQHTRGPDARCYLRYLKMVRTIRAQLEGAGLKPQDGLDLHDFIYLTLRPAARKAIVERVKARARKPAPVRLLGVKARESGQEAA